MGSGSSVHKRGAPRSLERQGASRQPYRKVLVVCEGEKTEPNYFSELRDQFRLNSAAVEICGQGSDPHSLFRFAQQRYRAEKKHGDPFDKVFCVFDKDSHASYSNARQAIRAARPKDTFEAIHSVPCFEYWLLLHFVYTTHPYSSLPGRSACHQVEMELKQHMPYSKGDKNIFNQLAGNIDRACDHAQRSLQAAERAGTDNPTTRVHRLVDYLQHIKDQPVSPVPL